MDTDSSGSQFFSAGCGGDGDSPLIEVFSSSLVVPAASFPLFSRGHTKEDADFRIPRDFDRNGLKQGEIEGDTTDPQGAYLFERSASSIDRGSV